ncbi:MAG TPA: four helix bundle protein [Candidatus Polarisedimenticolaceae bacterium]
MDALRGESGADRRLRAFRATDAFALEVIVASRALDRGEGAGLARDIRTVAARCGGALVAATAGPSTSRETLEGARAGLFEIRYYLYLARRLGFLDLRRYRDLAARQDAALRELDGLLDGAARPGIDIGQERA